MKKVFLSLFSAFLAFTMVLPLAAPAMADAEQEAEVQAVVKAALMLRNPSVADVSQPVTITLSASQGLDIKAPRATKVGETITITVSERFSGQPVKGAAVYARKIKELSLPQVTRQSNTAQARGIARIIHPLWAALQKIVRPNTIVTTSDNKTAQLSAEAVETAPEEILKYAADIKDTGIFIGNTDEEGKVNYAFAQPGMYVLIATKDDYAPGFARITVNPGNQKNLGIKAPATADVGKPVTITVIERNIGNPVGRAAVYAVKIDNAAGYPLPLESATSAEAVSAAEVEKYAIVAREKGDSIGNTDDSGKVTHTFIDTGRYILVTAKDGYGPGFARITITLAAPRALFIKAHGEANTGQKIPIAVYTRQGYQPVENAAVYAIKWNVLPAPTPVENGTATQILRPQPLYATEAEKYAALTTEEGFIGYTDSNGQVFHAFNEAGRYTLVAIEDGYTPAFTTINIGHYRMMNPKKLEEAKPTILQSTPGSSNSKKFK